MIGEIAANVVLLRELEPLRDVDRTFITRAELEAFLVGELEELYVISELERFGPNEEVTFAHEYVHALQQQYFDIYTLGKRVEEDSDAGAALSALIEGDAYLMTFEYINGFLSPQEQQEVFESGGGSPVLDGGPYAVQKLFFFDVEGASRSSLLYWRRANWVPSIWPSAIRLFPPSRCSTRRSTSVTSGRLPCPCRRSPATWARGGPRPIATFWGSSS